MNVTINKSQSASLAAAQRQVGLETSTESSVSSSQSLQPLQGAFWDEKRRRRAGSIPQAPDGTSFPAQRYIRVQQNHTRVFPSLSGDSKQFLQEGRVQTHMLSPKANSINQKARAKTTSGLGVTAHRSRVEFSCSLSLSMTG